MRILSQDGIRDIPYEQVAVIQDARDKRKIVATGVNTEGEYSCFPMAKYSTETKAKRAMEMLREFNEIMRFENIKATILDNEEFVKTAKKYFFIEIKEDKTKGQLCHPQTITLEKWAKYFQFPADEELED